MSLTIVLVGIASFAWLIFKFLTWNYKYWENRSVPTVDPVPLFGNMKDLFLQKTNGGEIYENIYNKFKGSLYCGVYIMRKPALVMLDSEMVKNVLIKDFSSFHDNDIIVDEKVDPMFGKNPFCLTGQRWKLVRGQITQALTSGKVKNMFPLIVEVNERLTNYLLNEPDSKSSTGLCAKELASKYTTDVVASCAFGFNAQSFTNPKAEFREIGRKMFEVGAVNGIKFLILIILPSLAKILNMKFISDKVADFFRGMVKETIKYRKENYISRNDYFDYMVQLRDKCTEYNFDEEHMAAHSVTFFTDGFETSSIAISYILYELAVNPDVFEKLREEIDEILEQENGNLTFEGMQKMNYLDCIVSESLRLHPPAPTLSKLCTTPYTLPNYKGEGAGPDLKVEVGTTAVIPVYALHKDERYFTDPEKFDPERFSDENKARIVKGSYIPFGDGPRICLGMRLALAQVKAAVVTIVSKFDIQLNPKTKTPLQIDPTYFLMAPLGGIWLNFSERKK